MIQLLPLIKEWIQKYKRLVITYDKLEELYKRRKVSVNDYRKKLQESQK
jgi:hypothetical protein